MPSRPSSMPFSPFGGDASSRRRTAIAYHEAAHAVTALHLGCRLRSVSIRPVLHHGIQGRMDCVAGAGLSVADEVLISLAGPVAEVLAGGGQGPRWERDFLDAREAACAVCRTEAEVDGLLERQWERAMAALSDPRLWAPVETLALALMESRHGEIDGRTAERICRDSAAAVATALAGA